ASRYLRISILGRSLCLAQTMPNTGAARFVQPGTGHSWIGALRRLRSEVAPAIANMVAADGRPGGRPGPRLRIGPLPGPPPHADRMVSLARDTAFCSISAES